MHVAALVVEWLCIVVVFLGAVPFVVAAYQALLVAGKRWRHHYEAARPYFPRVVVLVPAWNEAAVLELTLQRLVCLEYPADRLRVAVVDDASTDETGEVVGRAIEAHPGRITYLRREVGGEGKAHTLNHGIAALLGDEWMEALLIIDADVVLEPASLRKMTRHLADPTVGSVTAYIKEGSRRGGYVTRFIAHEYLVAQAVGRRAQEVLGAVACLAGGAQLHSRANLEAIGGRIDTSCFAEDTVTTFKTQLAGKKVLFEGNAVVWAEEPRTLRALFRQRLRWSRGNVAVTRQFKGVFFRRADDHKLGGVVFGLAWWSVLLQPFSMIASSLALVVLYLVDFSQSWAAFRGLWILNAVSFALVLAISWSVDPQTTRRSWREALLFPGVVSLVIILYSVFPRPVGWAAGAVAHGVGLHLAGDHVAYLAVDIWLGASLLVAYLAMQVEPLRVGRLPIGRWLSTALVYLSGFGAFLCATGLVAIVKELRNAESTWERTVKSGQVAGAPG